jgi:hypothetical protein
LRSWWARTLDDLEIESTAGYKAPQSPCGAGRKVALAFAASIAARFWCVESDKPDCLPANADHVTINHLHGARSDRLRTCGRRQRGERKSYGGAGVHVGKENTARPRTLGAVTARGNVWVLRNQRRGKRRRLSPPLRDRQRT